MRKLHMPLGLSYGVSVLAGLVTTIIRHLKGDNTFPAALLVAFLGLSMWVDSSDWLVKHRGYLKKSGIDLMWMGYS